MIACVTVSVMPKQAYTWMPSHWSSSGITMPNDPDRSVCVAGASPQAAMTNGISEMCVTRVLLHRVARSRRPTTSA